jgi:hypothetical protein
VRSWLRGRGHGGAVSLRMVVGLLLVGCGRLVWAADRVPGQVASEVLAVSRPELTVRFLTRQVADGTHTLAAERSPSRFLYSCTNLKRSVVRRAGRPQLWNPSVQRIEVATGEVTTILRGLDGCSALTVTPWGTLLVGESVPDGGLYEVLQPGVTRGAVVLDRSRGLVDPAHARWVRRHETLPRMPWGGVFGGSYGGLYAMERRVASGSGSATIGGFLYKFLSAAPFTGWPVSDFDRSPLARGLLQVFVGACRSGAPGAVGCDAGGTWLTISPRGARAAGLEAGAFAFDDARELREWEGLILPGDSVYGSFCWTEGVRNRSAGSALRCAQERDAPSTTARPGIVTIVPAQLALTSSSFVFAPLTHHWLRSRNERNGALELCLQDGEDPDLQTEGCSEWGRVLLEAARPAGIAVAWPGADLAVVVHSSDDRRIPRHGGFATDDILLVDGFENVDRERVR